MANHRMRSKSFPPKGMKWTKFLEIEQRHTTNQEAVTQEKWLTLGVRTACLRWFSLWLVSSPSSSISSAVLQGRTSWAGMALFGVEHRKTPFPWALLETEEISVADEWQRWTWPVWQFCSGWDSNRLADQPEMEQGGRSVEWASHGVTLPHSPGLEGRA